MSVIKVNPTNDTLKTGDETKKPDNTDIAIDWCRDTIRTHQKKAFVTMLTTVSMVALILMVIVNASLILIDKIDLKALPPIATYLVIALIVLCLSIGTSIYRAEIKEIAKFEQYLVGFMRIRIAATNSNDKYETEVRKCLTEGAFNFESKSGLFGSVGSKEEKKVESPIPGHPGSDIGAEVLTKILNSFDIKAEAKKS